MVFRTFRGHWSSQANSPDSWLVELRSYFLIGYLLAGYLSLCLGTGVHKDHMSESLIFLHLSKLLAQDSFQMMILVPSQMCLIYWTCLT